MKTLQKIAICVIFLAFVLAGTRSFAQNVTIGTDTITGNGTYATAITLNTDFTATPDAAGITLSGVLSGTGGLNVNGPGVLTLTAVNTYTGATTLNPGGTLQMDVVTSLNGTSKIVFNGGTLAYNNTGATFNKAFDLNADTTLDIQRGYFVLNNAASLAGKTQTITITNSRAGEANMNGYFALNQNQTTTNFQGTFVAANGGIIAVEYNENGRHTLGANVTLQADAGGEIRISVNNINSKALVLNGGQVTLSRYLTNAVWPVLTNGTEIRSDSTLRVTDGYAVLQGATVDESIWGSGNLTITGDGTGYLALNNRSGATTYAGNFIVNGNGRLALEYENRLGANTGVVVGDTGYVNFQTTQTQPFRYLELAGGELQLNNAALVVTTTQNINVSGDTLVTVAQNATFASPLSGTGKITKTGTGTLTLTGNNTGFTGDLDIQTGTLAVGNGSAVTGIGNASSTINIASGAKMLVQPISYTDSGTYASFTGTGTLEVAANAAQSYVLGVDSLKDFEGTVVVNAGSYLASFDGATFQGGKADFVVDGQVRISVNNQIVELGSLSGTNAAAEVRAAGDTTATGVTFKVGGNNKDTTFAGIFKVQGGAASHLEKVGDGTLTLTGISTMTGNITVSEGTLSIQDGGRFSAGSAVLTVKTGATLLLDHFGNSGNLGMTGTNTLRVLDGGTIVLSGNSLSDKAISVTANGGQFLFNPTDASGNPVSGSANAFSWSYTAGAVNRYLKIAAGGTLQLGGWGDINMNVGIQGSGGTNGGIFEKVGTGTIVYTKAVQANENPNATGTRLAEVIVSEGTLDLQEGSLLNTAKVTVKTGGTLKMFNFADQSVGGSLPLLGDAANRVLDGGTIIITGDHDTDKAFTVAANGSAFLYNPIDSENTLIFNQNGNRNIILNAGSSLDFGGVGNIDLKMFFSGAGNLTKVGDGTLAIHQANDGTGAQATAYTGVTTLSGGSLQLAHTQAIAGSTGLVFDGGTLDLAVAGADLGGVETVTVTGNGGTYHSDHDFAFTAPVAGESGTLTKTGTSALGFQNDVTLAGLNVNAGSIAFGGGSATLQQVKIGNVAGDIAFQTAAAGQTLQFTGNIAGDVTASGLGRLDIQTAGTDRITGNLTVTGGVFSPGTAIGVTNVGGNFTASNADVLFEISGFDDYDRLAVGGTADFSGVNAILVDFSSFAGYTPAAGDEFLLFEADSVIPPAGGSLSDLLQITGLSDDTLLWNLSFQQTGEGDWFVLSPMDAGPSSGVPEPATWVMLILGSAGVLWLRKRRMA